MVNTADFGSGGKFSNLVESGIFWREVADILIFVTEFFSRNNL